MAILANVGSSYIHICNGDVIFSHTDDALLCASFQKAGFVTKGKMIPIVIHS